MTMKGTVTTQPDAVAVVNGVVLLATPCTLLGMMCAFLGDVVSNRGADLLDLHIGKGRSDVEGGIDVMLKVSEGIGTGEAGQAIV